MMEKPKTDHLGQAYKCTSCGGIYYPEQPGGYFHVCPKGTLFPRNENIDDSDPKHVRPIKGKARDKGGAQKVNAEGEPI